MAVSLSIDATRENIALRSTDLGSMVEALHIPTRSLQHI